MPSVLTDFNTNGRTIKTKIEVDLDGAGYVDYTNYLDNWTTYKTLSQGTYGVVESTLNARLQIINPTVNWFKRGRKVRVSVIVSSDNWVTNFPVVIFDGVTNQQKGVTDGEINLDCVSFLEQQLNTSPPGRSVLTGTVQVVVQTLIANTLPTLTTSIPAKTDIITYPQRPSITLREHLEDFAAAYLGIIRFNISGVLEIVSLFQALTGTYTATDTYTLSHVPTGGFKRINLSNKQYFNSVTVKGDSRKYFYGAYSTTTYSGTKIAAGDTIFLTPELGGTVPISIDTTSIVARDTDDDIGVLDGGGVVVTTSSIVRDKSTDKILVKIKNNNTTEAYLRSVTISGAAVKSYGPVLINSQNTGAVSADGGEIILTIQSGAIQNEAQANELTSLAFVNVGDYYNFEHRARPGVSVGSTINFRDKTNVAKAGLVIQEEVEFSRERGYIQKLLVKGLPSDDYLALDDPTRGLDDAAYKLL